MNKLTNDNIMIIGDLHIPFERKGYVEFCSDIQYKHKCGIVVLIGDLVDNHSINYFEHDPDGWSPAQEMDQADKVLKTWFKIFPKLYLCRGNHDCLVDRKGRTSGLPKRAFRPYREIWNLPKLWIDDFEFIFHGVKFIHGTGYSGKYAHVNAADSSRQSTVIGHVHSVAGVEWNATTKDCIFGMSVGCGVDDRTYAFAYGRAYRRKSIVGCGIVIDKGKYPQFIPMKLK